MSATSQPTGSFVSCKSRKDSGKISFSENVSLKSYPNRVAHSILSRSENYSLKIRSLAELVFGKSFSLSYSLCRLLCVCTHGCMKIRMKMFKIKTEFINKILAWNNFRHATYKLKLDYIHTMIDIYELQSQCYKLYSKWQFHLLRL